MKAVKTIHSNKIIQLKKGCPRLVTRIVSLLMFMLLLACNQGEDTFTSSQSQSFKVVNEVNPLLDAANSRWFFFNSACRPFGMVSLSPDTQLGGSWGSGYKYNTDTIKGFSHIHAWQLAGVSVMPVGLNGGLTNADLLSDYYSLFSHDEEIVEVGYHKLLLSRYQISAELSSTTRVGIHRYIFPENAEKGIIFNLGGLLGPSSMEEGWNIEIDGNTIWGKVQNAPTRRRPKAVDVFFYAKLSEHVEMADKHESGIHLLKIDPSSGDTLVMKLAISYVSVENARSNLQNELPHWDFDQIVFDSKREWDELLNRIEISTSDTIARKRFYTDLWHSLLGRRIINDINGQYPDYTGEAFRVGQLPVDSTATPLFNHYNSDSFWGAQWTLNTLWGLVYPDIYEEFVNSLIIYYKDGGWVPRGPSGGNYTHVMTGASATPFIVSAYQKGIRGFPIQLAYEGMRKNHLPGGTMGRSGYEHSSTKGGGLEDYIQLGYVPYPNPQGSFGFHQDGASLTLEYAYQDWTLAQMAKSLGYADDEEYFLKRSKYYQNQFDSTSGWMRPKDVNGNWKTPFDPYLYENGFNESNAAQSTWFVPHDIKGLASLMGGNQAAIEKLEEQFREASLQNFTAGNSHAREENKDLNRVPINYGNQPSIQTAYIFHQLGAPEKTQYWSRKVVENAFSGFSPYTGYNGDEDQGLMGALAVLYKIGLFQMTGGTETNPAYAISSPVFDKVLIHLHEDYYPGEYFQIEVSEQKNNALYIAKANYNGVSCEGLQLQHSQIVEGGVLKLRMKE